MQTIIEKAARSVKYKHKKFAGYDSKGRKRWRYFYDDPKGGGVKGGKEQEALNASVSVGDVFKSGDGHIKVLMVASDGRIVYEEADGKKVNTTEEKLRNKLLSEHKDSIMDALEAGLLKRQQILDAAKKHGTPKQIERAEKLMAEWNQRLGSAAPKPQKEAKPQKETKPKEETKPKAEKPVKPKEEVKPKAETAAKEKAVEQAMQPPIVQEKPLTLLSPADLSDLNFEARKRLRYVSPDGLSRSQQSAVEAMLEDFSTNLLEMHRKRASADEIRAYASKKEAEIAEEFKEMAKEVASKEALVTANQAVRRIARQIEQYKKPLFSRLMFRALKEMAATHIKDNPKNEKALKERFLEAFDNDEALVSAIFDSDPLSVERLMFEKQEKAGEAVREKKLIPAAKAIAGRGEDWKTPPKKKGIFSKKPDSALDTAMKQAASLSKSHAAIMQSVALRLDVDSDPSQWTSLAVGLEQEAMSASPNAIEPMRDVAAWLRSTGNASLLGYEPLPLAHIAAQRKTEQSAMQSMTYSTAREVLESAGLQIDQSFSVKEAQEIAGSMELLKSIGARSRMLTIDEVGGVGSMGQISLKKADISAPLSNVSSAEGVVVSAAYNHLDAEIKISASAQRGMESFAHEMWHAVDFNLAFATGQNSDAYGLSGDMGQSPMPRSEDNEEGRSLKALVAELLPEMEKAHEASLKAEEKELRDRGYSGRQIAEAIRNADSAREYLLSPIEVFARFGEQWTSHKVAEAQAQGRIASSVSLCQPYTAMTDPRFGKGQYLSHETFVKFKDKFEKTAFFKKIQGTLEKGLRWRIDVASLLRNQ